MKTTLVIMAAGIGSRYGGGIKQLAAVGPNGEIIMDYSIHDAIEAGFEKLVFIIRKDIEQDFLAVIGNRIEAMCSRLGVEVAYAFQELENLPKGFRVPEGRKKPWGTGQAVLVCRELIHEPFAVINADDYYGKDAFRKIHDYLVDNAKDAPYHLCMAGFILKNTLSDNGSVTRGICQVDERNDLRNVVETKNIVKIPNGAASNGQTLDPNTYVSMNMWGMNPEMMDVLDSEFCTFLRNLNEDATTVEYLLPTCIGKLLQEHKVTVKVLPTTDQWFGVTYQEDKEMVVDSIGALIADGIYPADLFSDLT